MAKVIDLSDRTPHLHTTDPVTRKRHVIPLSMLRDIYNGRLNIDDIEDRDGLLRSTIYMLVDMVEEEIKD